MAVGETKPHEAQEASGYGAVVPTAVSGAVSSRRAAIGIGVLLATCAVVALSTNGRSAAPSELIAGFVPVKMGAPAQVEAAIGSASNPGPTDAENRVPHQRGVEWVPVARTVYGGDDLNDLYKRSEDALLKDINEKLQEKVAIEVEQQVAEKVPKMQSAIIREQKMKQLVSDITNQMGDVNKGFDQIQVMQAKGHEMFADADRMEADVTSPETKDLFDRAEAILLAMNASADCGNGTNASGCNSTNATDTGTEEDAAVEAAEKAIHAQALSLQRNKIVLSKILHEEHVKLEEKKLLKSKAERTALQILKKEHPRESLAKLEHQYEADKRLEATHARRPDQKSSPTKIALHVRERVQAASKKRGKKAPLANKKVIERTEQKVEKLQQELRVAKAHDHAVLERERAKEAQLRKEVHAKTPADQRAAFMKHLASEADQSKKFLAQVQHVTPLADDAERSMSRTIARDPKHKKLVAKEHQLEKELAEIAKKAVNRNAHP